jgi:hypothetical protein
LCARAGNPFSGPIVAETEFVMTLSAILVATYQVRCWPSGGDEVMEHIEGIDLMRAKHAAVEHNPDFVDARIIVICPFWLKL